MKATIGTRVFETTVDLPSIDANLSVSTALTIGGIEANRLYLVAFADASINAGLMVQAVVMATADDTLTVRVLNTTAGALDPASASMVVVAI